MHIIRENKSPIVIALVQWFLTTVFQIDRLFFTYSKETKIYIGVKILYFIFLVIVWCFLFHVYRRTKERDEIYQRGVYFFSCYLIIVMALLLILWPGTWSWDDLWTLNSIQYYGKLMPTQHILTGLYQDVLLQILPFPGGVILLQNIIISVCVAFSVTKLETSFRIKKLKYKSLDIIIKIIPFLLFPVLMYQFSGYRIGMYMYLELVMLVILICAIKDSEEWHWKYAGLFSVLCVVVSSWRTEAFFYIPFSCLLVFLINKTVLPNKKKIFCVLVILVGFMGINAFQNYFLESNNYKLISLLRPCTELVRVADQEKDAKLLEDIDRVVSLKMIYDNPEINGVNLYWTRKFVHTDYTGEDYNAFFKAFLKLSMKYPETVISERWELFIKGSGITGSSTSNVDRAAILFDENNDNNAAKETSSQLWIADTPVFKDMRKSLIYILGGNKSDGTVVVPFKKLIWNAIIPLMLLLFAWIRLLIKKKWYLLILCTAVLIRFPIVVLTQPSSWFMYLLSFYLLGYVYLTFQLLISFSKREEIKEK